MHFSKEKMETSLGTVFYDVFRDENLLIFDDYDDKFLDFVEVS